MSNADPYAIIQISEYVYYQMYAFNDQIIVKYSF